MDPKKLTRLLARKASSRTAVSMITGSDSDLVTDDEVELLEDVANGKDPFEIRHQEKKDDAREQAEGPVEVHFSSLGDTVAGRSLLFRRALESQVGRFALYDVDPKLKENKEQVKEDQQDADAGEAEDKAEREEKPSGLRPLARKT